MQSSPNHCALAPSCADDHQLVPNLDLALSPVTGPISPPDRTTSNLSSEDTLQSAAPTAITVVLNDNDATGDLEFEQFSFRGRDGNLSGENLSSKQLAALQSYLRTKFGVVCVDFSFPFLILGCKEDTPPETARPFTIGGAIAVWKTREEFFSFNSLFGDFAWGVGREIQPSILSRLIHLRVPDDEVVLYLANHVFPNAVALTFLWDCLVIEMPSTSDESFQSFLKSAPEEIVGAPVQLRYSNGPLPNTERRRRQVLPDATWKQSWKCDETDYAKLDGKFYPGTMVSSTDRHGRIFESVSAGILIRKDEEHLLTTSYYCWQKHVNKYPDSFGKNDERSRRIFKFVQGSSGEHHRNYPGTDVGYVKARVGQTDIALAKLHEGINFENNLVGIRSTPKTFLPSQSQDIGDEYVIDSFTCGKQKMKGMGRRFVIESIEGFHVPKDVKPTSLDTYPREGCSYIKLKQGAYATTADYIPGKPLILDRTCGAVLVRSKMKSRPAMKQAEVLDLGEVSGMMHYADLIEKPTTGRGKTLASEYICYADSFDPLIDEGWEIVPVPKENGKLMPNKRSSELDEDETLGKKRKVE